MPKAKREAMTGRGAVGKTIVAGAKDRQTNAVSARTVPNTQMATLQGFVKENAVPCATIYTDEAPAYVGMRYNHESVNHSAGEYVRNDAHTQGIESFWSMFKRGYQGTYHKMSPKHLERYVTEFAERHNDRDADTVDQMGKLAKGMTGKRLRYEDLIADNGLESGARA